VVPWFFYAQHPSAVDHDDAGDTADSKSKQHPPSKEGGFNMFKFLARTLADGQGMFGCRRTFLRHLLHRITTLTISTVAVLFAQTIYTKQLKAESTGRPNIVIIMADDHGYSDLSCQGIQDDIRTPNIDRLATSGVRMTSGYVSLRNVFLPAPGC
jgi:hypothetical protein